MSLIYAKLSELTSLSSRLSELGQHVGNHILDVLFFRERGYKREVKLLNMLLFIKGSFWRVSEIDCTAMQYTEIFKFKKKKKK